MDADPAVGDDDIRSWPTGRLLSVAARLVESHWALLLEQLGLTHAGLIALHTLAGDALPQRVLAQRCKVTDQTMSRIIDRLRRSGFIERGPDPEDGRRVLVRVTPAGRGVYERAVLAEREDPVIAGAIGEDERFRRRLLEIVERLDR